MIPAHVKTWLDMADDGTIVQYIDFLNATEQFGRCDLVIGYLEGKKRDAGGVAPLH